MVAHLMSGWRFSALIFTVVVSGIGYLFLSLWGGWEQVASGIGKIGWNGLIFALSFSLINYFIRFNRWNYFLLRLGQKVPFWDNLRIYIAGFALTATPGKSGEALRGVFLHDFQVPYRKSFAAFLAERFSDLFAVALLAAVGLWTRNEVHYSVMFTLAVVVLVLFLIQQELWLKKFEKFAEEKFTPKIAHFIEFMVETILSFRECFTTRALTIGTILGVLAWAAEGVAFFYILQLLGVDISLHHSIFVYAVSLLIGALTLLPGGLGGVEVTMIQLLIMFGADAATAACATIMIRLTTLWFSVFLGLIALPKKQLVINNVSDKSV